MTQTHRPLAAALWMIGAICSFSVMAVAGRAVSGVHDTFEIMLFRSVIGLGIVSTIALATRRQAELRTRVPARHALRNLAHFTGQNLWFWALTMIPLAQVFALEFTSPLWVILLAPFLLGERITLPRALAAALGFVGIWIVANPDFSQINPGVAAAAASAICFAFTTILTKRLTTTETTLCIMFWLTLMQLVMGLVAAGHDGDITLPLAATAPWLVVIGLAGLVAHFCITTALSLAPATTVVPVDFARLPVIMLVGWLVYDEQIEFAVLVGSAFILTGIWVNLRFGKVPGKPQTAVKESVTWRQ